MGLGMGLNLVLLVTMVATNIFSLYHLSSTHNPSPTPPHPVPDHLLHQLSTIRATMTATHYHLVRLRSTSHPSTTTIPHELLLLTTTATTTTPNPIGTACQNHPDLLHRFMNYTPFSLCPDDPDLVERLMVRGCHPLPRRRCFSPTPPKPTTTLPTTPFPTSLPNSALRWNPYSCKTFDCLARFDDKLGFDLRSESIKWVLSKNPLDLTAQQFLQLTKSITPIRVALDIGGGTGTFAARMKLHNVTVVSTTLNLGAPYNEVMAIRGLVPLHVPLQQRFPIFDGAMDLIHCGHAVNRWIPVVAMEFLFYDVDRVLRSGGFLWLDHFFCKMVDLERVYGPLIGKLGYRKIKWVTGNKTDSGGLKNGEVYLTAVLQKPVK